MYSKVNVYQHCALHLEMLMSTYSAFSSTLIEGYEECRTEGLGYKRGLGDMKSLSLLRVKLFFIMFE